MKLKIGETHSGFKLMEVKNIPEVKSKTYFFKHVRLGTELLYMENDDEERAFCIGFKTPVFDNTGVNHILEHSVFNGSKNYPTRDVFAMLLKSTSSTFINAMTYPDKTVYPIATTYESEFKKLMSVYMDVVFYPRVYTNKNVFMQEGWRYEFDKNGKLTYNGVVFNEMKGALSGTDRLFWYHTFAHIFPDNFYKYESGGDPKSITRLTHKKLVSHHKKYYHPSNARIFIYGKTELLKHLDFIDTKYFLDYKKEKVDSLLSLQKKWMHSKDRTEQFFVPHGLSTKEKSFLTLSYLLPSQKNRRDMLGLSILADMLFEKPSSPVKRVLLEENFCGEVTYEFEPDLIQGIFSILCKNTDIKHKKLFKKIILENLEKITKEGINIKLVYAAINKAELGLEESVLGAGEGVEYSQALLRTWLYGYGHTRAIEFRDDLAEIKRLAKDGYFEKLIRKYLLQNKNVLLLTLEASRKNDPEKVLKEQLKKAEKKLSKKEKEGIKNELIKFAKYQKERDSGEVLKKLKPLSVLALPKRNTEVKLKEKYFRDIEYLYHKTSTQKISYLDMYFDAGSVSGERAQYLELLAGILPKEGVEGKDYNDFQNELDIYFGGITYSLMTINSKSGKVLPKFVVRAKFLNKNLKKCVNMMGEIINRVCFDKDRIKNEINEQVSRMENNMISSGHEYAILSAGAGVSEKISYDENISGINYYNFLKKISDDIDNNADAVVEKIEEVYREIFSSVGLTVSSAASRDYFSEIKKMDIKIGKRGNQKVNIVLHKKKSGIIVNSQVQYNAIVSSFDRKKYHGSMEVFSAMMRYEYLWRIIREKGGAYGAVCKFDRDGVAIMVSYRDPRLEETFSDYEKIVYGIENDDVSQDAIDGYIVKAISTLDAPKSLEEKSLELVLRHMARFTATDLQKTRNEILETTPADLNRFIEILKQFEKKANIATVGGSSKVLENKSLFDEIVSI